MRNSTWLLCALVTLMVPHAFAQSARKDNGGNAQLMQQMQQLAAERTSLQAENARMKRELDETRKERDALKGGKESTDKRVRASEVALARMTQEREQGSHENEQLKSRTQELIGKFRETIEELRTVESDRNTLKQQLATRDTEFKSCAANNATLYKLNDEILTRFEKQGFWNGVARAEPFTRLKRVELENLADEYRGKADDAKLTTPAPQDAGPAPRPPG